MRYVQRFNGKGFTVPSKQPTRWRCCDCGLVHDIVLVSGRGVVGVAARVNKRATAASRRHR